MIYIRTRAYNASKTLCRAINSILNQTMSDFKFYICDNGSTDNGATRKIIDEYAKDDLRIVAFSNIENNNFSGNEAFHFLALQIKEDDFFCTLDADDEYEPTFLEDTVCFMTKNNLDVACCGNDFIDTDTNCLIKQRKLDYSLVFDTTEFSKYFMISHQYLRTPWAKLITGKALKNTIWDQHTKDYPKAYGGDTYMNLQIFKDSSRIGILAKSLHKYYVSSSSVSYIYNPNRIDCDQILHQCTLDFLKNYGEISEENLNFLYKVYFNAVHDTFALLSQSVQSVQERLHDIHKVFACKHTKDLVKNVSGEFKDHLALLQESVFEYIMSDNVQGLDNSDDLVSSIIADMYGGIISQIDHELLMQLIKSKSDIIQLIANGDYENALVSVKQQNSTLALIALEISLSKAIPLTDSELLLTYAGIKSHFPKYSMCLSLDDEINSLLKAYPLIACLSANLAVDFLDSVCLIIKGDPVNALVAFLATENVEIDDEHADSYFKFALNLTALADNVDAFLYFKKAWVNYLIDINRHDDARHEISELLLLMPNDPELKALQVSI